MLSAELTNEIEKNFSKIEKFFAEEALLELSGAKVDDLEKYQIGPGTLMRLKLLRSNNILCKKFVQEGFGNKDEMSMVIIKEFQKHIRDRMYCTHIQKLLHILTVFLLTPAVSVPVAVGGNPLQAFEHL